MAGPVRSLLGSAAGLVHTRVELLGTELREEFARFAFLLIGAGLTMALALIGLGIGSAAIILAAGADHRVAAAAGLTAVFTGAAAYAAWRVRAALAAKPVAFAASLAELEEDRRALVAQSAGQRAAVGQGTSELMRLISIGVLAYSIVRRLR